jgi:D-glycero-alpha-D-manno-heptose-7-phosphate kinase
MSDWIEASAPARVDLAGGTLDLWPLHVLHPGSVTVNLAIGLRARCRVRRGATGFRVTVPDLGYERRVGQAGELLSDPRGALAGALLEALDIQEPQEIELSSEVPFGSGLGGSSAMTVAMAAGLAASVQMPFEGPGRVDLVRDVETRVLGKPAGVQDYYPPLTGGLHRLLFEPGRTHVQRRDADARAWLKHLTVFDTGAAHASGMNNWEIYRARLEGDRRVAEALDRVRAAARSMAEAAEGGDFEAMGKALAEEWDARRRLAPVVSSPAIERAIGAAAAAGAWGGKACGAGGGGCVVFLSPPERSGAVREALGRLPEGRILSVAVENQGLEILSSRGPGPEGSLS